METRVALIGIIVEDKEGVAKLNEILHEYGSYIIGRMGIPYRERNISIISVVVDAPADVSGPLQVGVGLPGQPQLLSAPFTVE